MVSRVGVRSGRVRLGAWKFSSRSAGGKLGKVGGDGERLSDGRDEGDDGGNSSKICGCGKRCWAVAGARQMNRSNRRMKNEG